MTKGNPHANSEVDPSHIIQSKRRAKPTISYNEDARNPFKPTRSAPPVHSKTATKKTIVKRIATRRSVATQKTASPKVKTQKTAPPKVKTQKSAPPKIKTQKEAPKKTTPKKVATPKKTEKRKRTARQTSPSTSSDNDTDEFSASEDDEDDSVEEMELDEEEEEEEEKVPVKKGKKKGPVAPSTKRKVLSLTPTSSKRKPVTSTNRTIHRINQVAPVLPLRRVNAESSTASTPYALARERLHVSAVPNSLPCREDEFMDIMGYIESAIHEATGTCVYISGVPGTGKTATVLEVIRHLQQQAEDQTIPPFDFVEINGMKLTDPNQAYSILWECMDRSNKDGKQKRYTSAHALQLLESKFSKQSEDQRTTVVLMDELDLLVTKKQTVMYNFFDWPSRPLSKLIVVAVANTMDLPERIMSNKIASRMGLTRINFQPYKYDQLYQIVQSRLEGIDTFAKEAVEFAARKVSAVSGDARRALDICRRAVEIVEARLNDNDAVAPKHVTIAIVDQAIKEMFTSPSVSFIRSCSLHQKIFLVACMQRSRAIGLAEIEFGDVAHYHIQTCKWHNIEPPNTSDLMRVCESLSQTRALLMEGGRMDICMRLSLNLVEEDIVMACKADKLISRLLQNLPTTN